MKILFWSVVAAIVLVEILAVFFRLNIWRRRADALERAAFTFAEAQDDREQQRILISAAFNLLGLVLYVWVILAVFFYVLTEFPDEINLNDDVFVWTASASFIAYAWLRAYWDDARQQRQAAKAPSPEENSNTPPAHGGYRRIARWLHWMALEIGLVRRTSFDLEKALFLRQANHNPRIIDQPVYVMGLARSGTTVVLEILEKTGAFHSPTYRDMPFILCPNLWDRLSRYSRMEAQLATRAHGDGLAVGYDSPESFEEVFWRTASTPQPGPVLNYPTPDDEVMADFAAYRSLSVLSALSSDSTSPLRYLSKNNNNVLRMRELSAQPGARLVLVIRDPLATAWSLYRQHLRFSEMQANDPFVRAYMRWLGHHEFGLGHKPLAIGQPHLKDLNPQRPDYWLAYWIGIYENLWQTYRGLPAERQASILWMSHERMCEAPAEELSGLFQFVHIEKVADEFAAMLKAPAT